nr:thioredoxin fold domain-containing protein [Candidatus Enterovibrio luxaltus]
MEIITSKRNETVLEAVNIEEELIVYPAKDEKYIINIFTNTICGYCMKLHRDMRQYNDLDITVNYRAFPSSSKVYIKYGSNKCHLVCS